MKIKIGMITRQGVTKSGWIASTDDDLFDEHGDDIVTAVVNLAERLENELNRLGQAKLAESMEKSI